jgi:hypothetical protein
MNIRSLSYTAFAAMLTLLLLALPASAQISPFKLFVSRTGDDAHDCSNPTTDACKTFARAVSSAQPSRLIVCVDSDDFGYITIDKTVTIDCTGTSASTPGITINGSGIVVVIRGLVMNTNTIDAILFQNGAALIVENCAISGFNATGTAGIKFKPSAAGSRLVVTDTSLTNNGLSPMGGGIIINPQSGGTAQVSLNRITVAKNVFGVAVDGNGSTGGINVTISDTVIDSNSQDGIIATTPSSGGAPIGVMVKNTRSVNNTIGIRSIGPNVTIRVDNSTVTGNSTGLSFNSFGTGGALLSFGNNNVEGNGTNGAFSGPVVLK